MDFHKIWQEQCAATRTIRERLLAAQYVLAMFRRTLPNGTSRRRLDRLSNRLTKIVAEARKLVTPCEWAEIDR